MKDIGTCAEMVSEPTGAGIILVSIVILMITYEYVAFKLGERRRTTRRKPPPSVDGSCLTPLASEVIDLVALTSGSKREDISLETTLLGDLHVDGDDAWELVMGLHEKFGIDFSEFEFKRHFRDEPCHKGIAYLFRLLKYGDEHLAAGKDPVTMSQLVRACETKIWQY